MVWRAICSATRYGPQCKMGTRASNNFLIYPMRTIHTKVSQKLRFMICTEYLFVLVVYSRLLLGIRLHFIIIFMHLNFTSLTKICELLLI